MALTRTMLKALGIEADKIDEIINGHTETVNALKEERDNYKATADKYETIKADYDKLKAEEHSDFKAKYEKEHSDFEAYKTEQSEKAVKQAKNTAFKQLLKEIGISDKRVEAVAKITDFGTIELDEKGAIKDSDKLSKTLAEEWKEFIVTENKTGKETANPPAGNCSVDYDSMSDSDYYKAVYDNKNKNKE